MRLIDKESLTPIYPYDSIRPASAGDGTLYHFTSIESAKIILRDLTLKLSDPRNFNDLSDVSLNNVYLSPGLHTERLLNSIKVLCFTRNRSCEGVIKHGHDYPRMWAQYAANHTGVCIAIDKDCLIKENRDVFEKHKFIFGDVCYSAFPPQYDKAYTDLAELIEDGFYFYKHKDWQEEEEYRLVAYDFPDLLSIRNSVSFIILGAKVLEDDARQLVSILNDPNNASFGCFNKQSILIAKSGPGAICVQTLEEMSRLPDSAHYVKLSNLTFVQRTVK